VAAAGSASLAPGAGYLKKSLGDHQPGAALKFAIIAELVERYPVKGLCQQLQVSRSGYYAWCQRGPSQRQQANQQVWGQIQAAYEQSRGTYGYRRIHAALRAKGIGCGIQRVRRLMQQHGLCARRKSRYRTTTDSHHRLPIAPNHLARQFSASAANQKWVSDITFVATQEGWLYLCVTLDLFSRRVVGWAMETSLHRELGLKALRMALVRRRPPAGLLHHSDQGVQYANSDFQHLLASQQAVASMSRTGNVYDNAPMESFFATLKQELIAERIYPTRAAARLAIFEFLEVFYNQERLHSALHYRSPADFENILNAP
jgi:transposase InsO family protein